MPSPQDLSSIEYLKDNFIIFFKDSQEKKFDIITDYGNKKNILEIFIKYFESTSSGSFTSPIDLNLFGKKFNKSDITVTNSQITVKYTIGTIDKTFTLELITGIDNVSELKSLITSS